MNSDNWPLRLFIIDLETTGLDPVTCGIVGCSIRHPATGDVATWAVLPRMGCAAEPAAMRVNGVTWDDLKQRNLQTECGLMFELMDWIRARVPVGTILLVGRNPSFDRAFLEEMGKRDTGVAGACFRAMFSHRVLDLHGAVQVLALALGWPIDVDRIDDLYRRLGQQLEPKPHTAAGGARHAQEALVMMVREVVRLNVRSEELDQVRQLLADANASLMKEVAKSKALFEDYQIALTRIADLEREAARMAGGSVASSATCIVGETAAERIVPATA